MKFKKIFAAAIILFTGCFYLSSAHATWKNGVIEPEDLRLATGELYSQPTVEAQVALHEINGRPGPVVLKPTVLAQVLARRDRVRRDISAGQNPTEVLDGLLVASEGYHALELEQKLLKQFKLEGMVTPRNLLKVMEYISDVYVQASTQIRLRAHSPSSSSCIDGDCHYYM